MKMNHFGANAPRALSAARSDAGLLLADDPCRSRLPVILSYLLQQVYSISDAAIVGQTL